MVENPVPHQRDVDVVVVGGGMVGATCAAALLKAGLRCVLVERVAPSPVDLEAPPGLRVSAVSRASENLLEHIGAWRQIVESRAAPFRRMAVWEQDDGAETLFDSAELAESHLGYIVENALIQTAALAAFEAAGGEVFCPVSVLKFVRRGSMTHVHLSDHTVLRTRLLVAADGARSALRAAAGIAAPSHAYAQHALVATVTTELPQQDITWQRFQPSGPEAMLPLTGNRASLVWYHTPEQIARLRELDADALCAEFQAVFPARLGRLHAVLEHGSFPLFKSHAASYVQPGFALIGDAAHSVHPLAGQGVNLGFMDAAALVEVVCDAHSARRDIGSERVLRRYERWRRSENAVMAEVLHGFQRGFGSTSPMAVAARRMVLQAGARVQPARVRACRHAMGLAGELPRLARPGMS